MIDLSVWSWILIALGAGLVGIAKVGIPGAGILVVPIMALAMGEKAKESVGLLLPILAIADILAIIYWRRHVQWRQLLRLMPWAFSGVFIGSVALNHIENNQLKPFIGAIVLALMGGAWWRQRYIADDSIPTHWSFAAVAGILAGALSMMANAAGPIMIVYFLAMRFDKKNFVGTQAWFFWVLNLSKMPFSLRLGLISKESLMIDVLMTPAIVVGALIGIVLVHRISQRQFDICVQTLAILAAIILITDPFH